MGSHRTACRGGGEANPEDSTGGPPKQHAFPAHIMQTREGGGRIGHQRGGTLEQRALPAHGMQEQGGGGTPSPKERGGHPPSRVARPLCAA